MAEDGQTEAATEAIFVDRLSQFFLNFRTQRSRRSSATSMTSMAEARGKYEALLLGLIDSEGTTLRVDFRDVVAYDADLAGVSPKLKILSSPLLLEQLLCSLLEIDFPFPGNRDLSFLPGSIN